MVKGGVAMLKKRCLKNLFLLFCGSFGVHGEGELEEIQDLMKIGGGRVQMLLCFLNHVIILE